MAVAKRTAPVSQQLGTEFWAQPSGVVMTDPVRMIYANVSAVLRQELESRDASVVDYMLAERIAATYALIREREIQEQLRGDALDYRVKREINQDWTTLALNIKKLWDSNGNEKASELVMKKFGKAVDGLFKQLPADQVEVIQKQLSEHLAAQGL